MNELDFEQTLKVLENEILTAKQAITASGTNPDAIADLEELEQKYHKLLKSIYAQLTPWQKVQIARHPERPRSSFYIKQFFTNLINLEGDRLGNVDYSILTNIGSFENTPVMIIAQEKGNDLESRQKHNFGMVSPAGYRKVTRCVEMANKWSLPIITFIDTPGAYPCKKAEEFGQAEAIAKCMAAFFNAQVPVISIVIGEGGSGGAIAIGVGNSILMLEHSIYSIASPEAVSSILYKNSDKKALAAQALKLTAQDLFDTSYVDIIVPEPIGGAHRQPKEMANILKAQLSETLSTLKKKDPYILMKAKEEKFLQFGR